MTHNRFFDRITGFSGSTGFEQLDRIASRLTSTEKENPVNPANPFILSK
jgi:hypothetical protein